MARARRCVLLGLAGFGWALLGAGCNVALPGKPNPKDRPVPAEDDLVFASVYGRNCAACHGADGRDGPAPPLNDPLFRALVSTQDLESTLIMGRRQGENETAMTAFAHKSGGPLSPAQVGVLVHQIKGLPYRIVSGPEGKTVVAASRSAGQRLTHRIEGGASRFEAAADEVIYEPEWGVPPPPPAGAPPYALPEKAGSAEKGAAVFARACTPCHGDNGAGVIQAGARRKKLNDVVFLSLISDQALRRIMITGRADLGMPDYANKDGRGPDFKPLTSAEIADVNALLNDWRKGSPARR